MTKPEKKEKRRDGTPPSELPTGAGRRVLVTGASGYLGSHIVKLLLEQGFRVRGAVRAASDENKVAHLQKLVESPEHPLEIVSADLLDPKSYEEAVAECELVCHSAASVRLSAKDPQREIVDPAVEGTKNVLRACRAAGTVRRVVVTSSVAAVTSADRPDGHVYTEEDWNDTATLAAPYPLAKTEAERAAWDFHEALAADSRFELVALLPCFVLGPVLARVHLKSSPSTVRDLMRRSFPACPQLYFNVVDVRDVARAHLEALVRPDVSGRYLLKNRGLWMQEMAQILAPRFPDHPIPTRRLPKVAMYAAALFDPRLTFSYLRRELGHITRLSAQRAQRDLGLEFRPIEQTLIDTAQSFVDLDLVRPRQR